MECYLISSNFPSCSESTKLSHHLNCISKSSKFQTCLYCLFNLSLLLWLYGLLWDLTSNTHTMVSQGWWNILDPSPVFLILIFTLAPFQMDHWLPELQTLGYKDPLFTPSYFSQAILASICSPSFHKTIIDHDFLAMSKNQPSVLLTASCNDWILLLQFFQSDPTECLNRLQALLGATQAMENLDHQDMLDYHKNLPIVFNKLENIISGNTSEPDTPSALVPINPLISSSLLSDDDKAKLASFSSSIVKKNSKFEDSSISRTDPALVIPLLPRRQLELDVAQFNHKLWVPQFLNYPAPFSTEALGLLLNSDSFNNAVSFQYALNCNEPLSDNIAFDLKFFSLALLDDSKCSNTQVFFQTKTPNPHDKGKNGYLRNSWNAFRPYVKCRCFFMGNKSCKAGIMWVDHLIWFMVHHLDLFFTLSSTQANLIACIGWLSSLPSSVSDAVLGYYFFHSLMVEKAKALTLPSCNTPNLPQHSKAHALISQMFSQETPLPSTASSSRNKRGRNSPYTPSSVSSSSSGVRLVRGARYTTSELTDVQRNIQWSS